MHLPLEVLEWRQCAPIHRPAARPRLRVPADRLSTAAKRQPRLTRLTAIRYWYAFVAPVDGEISAAQTAWRRVLTKPLMNSGLSVNYLLWVPVDWQHRPIFPGYVLVLTDQPIWPEDQRRLQTALYGVFGDAPLSLNFATDIPWQDVRWDAGWLSDSSRLSLFDLYRV